MTRLPRGICGRCVHCQPDRLASHKTWTAYQCVNRDSDYYGALLNISVNGNMLSRVVWHGCPLIKLRPDGERVGDLP